MSPKFQSCPSVWSSSIFIGLCPFPFASPHPLSTYVKSYATPCFTLLPLDIFSSNKAETLYQGPEPPAPLSSPLSLSLSAIGTQSTAHPYQIAFGSCHALLLVHLPAGSSAGPLRCYHPWSSNPALDALQTSTVQQDSPW